MRMNFYQSLNASAFIWGSVISLSAFAAPYPDYMQPDLRARVEALKVEAQEFATTAMNARKRSRILWEWINAYAIAGYYIPVNATQIISTILAYPNAQGTSRYQALDNYLYEFTFLDENPDGLGQLEADVGPFEAASHVSLQQKYTVGSRPIETGGGFLIARHFMANYGRFQATDATADNYVTIHSTNTKVRFAHGQYPVSGMHGGFRGSADALVFRLASGRLSPGDVVTITYGDTSEGSRGFRMSDVSSDQMPLPIYIDLTGSNQFFSLPIQPIAVAGTLLNNVNVFAPSVVATGEAFDISVRAEDIYYNRATGLMPGWSVNIGDSFTYEIAASKNPLTLIKDVVVTEPGVHFVSVHSKDGSLTRRSNPILVEGNPKRRIYWGDTHGHSGFAEGIGTPDRFMLWARDDARLDFVTHSEHDIWMDDNEWNVLRENVREYSKENQFIAFLGYEWTARNYQGGHHNVLFRNAAGGNRIPMQTHGTLSRLYQGLKRQHNPADIVVIPHAHQSGDYRLNDPQLEPLVEIMSQHGTFEWFGRMYLKQGHQIGFTAASDNHLSQPGYTAPKGGSLSQSGGIGAIRSHEKTRDALFDAMKDLSTYATTGERIILDVAINGYEMGQRAPFASTRKITGRVIGTAPIENISIIKNEESIFSRDYLESGTSNSSSRSGKYQITFSSSSEPLNRGDNPRGWRTWKGKLELKNAEFAGGKISNYRNSNLQSFKQLNEKEAIFSTITRGSTSSLVMDLNRVKRNASAVLTLDAAYEFGGGPPIYRPHQKLENADIRLKFSISESNSNRNEYPLPNKDYIDKITVRRIAEDGPFDVSFELEDNGNRQNDYYYVRVKQIDDAYAWSSPIWIGGYPTQ